MLHSSVDVKYMNWFSPDQNLTILFSQFDEKFEDLGGGATPSGHANVPKHQPTEVFNTTNAGVGQCSNSVAVDNNIQHSQTIPQDPSASHDFGGMTRIIPSDIDVSQIHFNFDFPSRIA